MQVISNMGLPPCFPVMKAYLYVFSLGLRCAAVLLAHHEFVIEEEYIIQNPLIIRAPFGLL